MTTKAIEAGARAALADLVFEAVKFLDWAAGEGIFYKLDNGETVEPDLIIEKAATALGLDDWQTLPKLARDTMLSAIASGELVPASAVAEMRERCAQVAGRAAERDAAWAEKYPDEARRCEERELRATTIAAAIRALEPASGEYVLVPRIPTKAMVDAATASTSGCGAPDEDYDDTVKIHWDAMLTAATSNGSGSK